VSSYSGPLCSGMPRDLNDLAHALEVVGDSGDMLDLQDSTRPTMADFFDRADDRLDRFDDWDAIKFLDTVDPTQSVEPHEGYGC
jgi:hypothetical protein